MFYVLCRGVFHYKQVLVPVGKNVALLLKKGPCLWAPSLVSKANCLGACKWTNQRQVTWERKTCHWAKQYWTIHMTQTRLVEYMYFKCTLIIPDVCDVLHWGGCSTKKCVDMWLPPHNGVCYSNFPMCIGGRFWKNVVQKENRKKKKKTSTSKYESYFTVQSTCLELIIQNLKISWGCHPSRMMEKPKTLQ